MKNILMSFTLDQKLVQKNIGELEHGSRETSKAEMQREQNVGLWTKQTKMSYEKFSKGTSWKDGIPEGKEQMERKKPVIQWSKGF